MTSTLIVFLLFFLPALGFGLYLIFNDSVVRINTGELGLVIRRGKPTDRTLLPGRHIVPPFGRMTIQTYPARELVYRTTRDAGSEDDANRATDPAIGVVLGDRIHATVCYTLRFTIDPSKLASIHIRFGPDGIYAIIRDVSEQVVADHLAHDSISYLHLFGEARGEVQTTLREALTVALDEHGFTLSSFGLREVDLGDVGQAIQAKARSQALFEMEDTLAAGRRQRAEHDLEVSDLLSGLSETALRYHQIEAWRSLVDRWDGRIGGLPGLINAPRSTETSEGSA